MILQTKKKAAITIVTAILITALAFCIYFVSRQSQNDHLDPFANLPERLASWHWVADNSQELVENSSIIGVGTVVDSYTAPIHDIVFTYNIVEFDTIYMLRSDHGNALLNQDSATLQNGQLTVKIIQTGGVYQDITTRPFKEAPLYEVGKSYLFFLDDGSDGHYLPTGGYQGCAEIVNGIAQFEDEFSSARFTELEVELDSMVSTLESITGKSVSTDTIDNFESETKEELNESVFHGDE